MRNEMSLEGYGVTQMDSNDSLKTEGGNPFAAALIIYLLWETAGNPVASKNAFWEGFNSTQK
ncbi:MAG: hypothetical protein CFE22_14980 [Cytophagaceae bacterium BCCC1]|nr:MAG: hypothetical protein CFE22_14980 [Cytophagaceae bacterium BCCC1]